MIVGTGLPQVCREREILKDYFDQHGQRGFDYAYLYPGMNKVLQAAGRVIRTDEDRGVILLLDDRFFDRRYQETFQENGKTKRSCSLGNKYGRADRRVLEKRKGRSTDRPEKRINIDALFFLRQAVCDFQIQIYLVYVVNNAVAV